ncbi:MAG: hypothetical protein NC483_06515 [Ruminococcus sp.]|nr:hypothetical protein [Ruminococcus sp.]
MERIILKDRDIAELIRAASAIEKDKMVVGTIGDTRKYRDYGTVIVSAFYVDKVVNLNSKPLNSKNNTYQDKTFNQELKRAFRLIKASACKIIQYSLERVKALAEREDDLDKEYQDSKGRRYYLDSEGYRIYIDDRGFDYYTKYIPDLEKEFAYIKLYDQDNNVVFGTFVDEERTLIQIDGIVYPMDINGNILYDEEVPYLGPRL